MIKTFKQFEWDKYHRDIKEDILQAFQDFMDFVEEGRIEVNVGARWAGGSVYVEINHLDFDKWFSVKNNPDERKILSEYWSLFNNACEMAYKTTDLYSYSIISIMGDMSSWLAHKPKSKIQIIYFWDTRFE